MAGNGREVALAIGVGDAKPLDYLGGAVNGARAFHDWASKLGYESKLVTDEDQPVTVARLRSELESMLQPLGQPIHRLLIYFAGHGLIREAEEGLWLLSDWSNELRAVAVEGLKRRLYLHNIKQIAVFADSCRSLPGTMTAADLTPDAVLGRGPIRGQQPAEIDKFVAAQDGSAAFMVPGEKPEDDRCLFSGVLMEGLWGTKPEAFSTLTDTKDKVTSRSLGKYLRAEVPKVAERYQRQLLPSVNPTFSEGDDVYFDKGESPPSPAFPDWPPPDVVAAMAAHIETAKSEEFGLEAAEEWEEEGPIRRELAVPTIPSPSLLIESTRNFELVDRDMSATWFVVGGGAVQGLWTPGDVFGVRHGSSNLWQLRQRPDEWLRKSVPVLIEFEDGWFVATAALPRFFASTIRDERGISALIYQPMFEPPYTAEKAESALNQMESGSLRADAVTDLAIEVRKYKHVDPVLGVIGAYLYDSIGDIDNIRRMAYYYAEIGQPIPYDIALLAQLRGEWHDGLLWAHVPAVRESKPRTDAERSVEWTHSATHETRGQVGGLWPWMRQGWTFLDDPADDGSTLITPGLIELISHLAPGRFAMLDAEGGSELAKIFDLSNNDRR